MAGLRGAGAVQIGSGSILVGALGSSDLFSGTIAGGGAVVKTGPGVSTFSGQCSVGGGVQVNSGTLALTSSSNSFTGNVRLTGGTLKIASDANLGAAANSINFSGGTLQSTGSFTTTTRAINLTAPGGAIDITSGNMLLASGVISGSGTLRKTGAGTLRLTSSNSFSGAIQIDPSGGRLSLSGSNGAMTPASLLNIALGGEIELNNTAGNLAERLSDAATLNFNGGALAMLGANGTASSELLGPLSLITSATTINLTAGGAGGSSSLSFASLQRQVGASLSITGISIGTTNKVLLRTAPGPIGAWLKVNGLSAKYDADAGIVPTSFPLPGPIEGLLWGDANLDGVVNMIDYTTTHNSLGLTPATWSNGDFNADRLVDQQDLNLLLSNNPSLLPEPTSFLYLVTAGARPRRKRKPISTR